MIIVSAISSCGFPKCFCVPLQVLLGVKSTPGSSTNDLAFRCSGISFLFQQLHRNSSVKIKVGVSNFLAKEWVLATLLFSFRAI